MKIEDDYVFPVYIEKKIIDEIVKICKKNTLEIFGYLAGEHYTWKGQDYINLSHSLFIKGAVHSNQYSVHEIGKKGIAEDIEYEFLQYSKEFDKLKEKQPTLLKLGWWHSHPSFGCFLSTTDVNTQSNIFYEPYHVALVVDPVRDYFRFFTLDKGAKDGYKELHYAIL